MFRRTKRPGIGHVIENIRGDYPRGLLGKPGAGPFTFFFGKCRLIPAEIDRSPPRKNSSALASHSAGPVKDTEPIQMALGHGSN
jgi:hypothetical protein